MNFQISQSQIDRARKARARRSAAHRERKKAPKIPANWTEETCERCGGTFMCSPKTPSRRARNCPACRGIIQAESRKANQAKPAGEKLGRMLVFLFKCECGEKFYRRTGSNAPNICPKCALKSYPEMDDRRGGHVLDVGARVNRRGW